MQTRLPPKPDFAAIEAAARDSADRRTLILSLIGTLVFSWSNNESMFIYVLMLLLDTDEVSAAIVFATLNTTRARLDLVQRLVQGGVGVALFVEQLLGRTQDALALGIGVRRGRLLAAGGGGRGRRVCSVSHWLYQSVVLFYRAVYIESAPTPNKP